jgi:hypothetical protein
MRLDLYDLIRQRLAIGRPVNPLIIAWDASHFPEARSLSLQHKPQVSRR